MTFIDWIPAIFSALGMLIVNSIDKTRLSADNFSYSGDGVAWKARVVLFMGFAAMAGGLAGGVTVMVLKYIVPSYPFPTLWFGVANVIANTLVSLRYAVLLLLAASHTDQLCVALSSCGFRKTWRTITPTTCSCSRPCRHFVNLIEHLDTIKPHSHPLPPDVSVSLSSEKRHDATCARHTSMLVHDVDSILSPGRPRS